jgi:hypothetical protein
MSHNSSLKDLELQKPPLPIRDRTQGAGKQTWGYYQYLSFPDNQYLAAII